MAVDESTGYEWVDGPDTSQVTRRRMASLMFSTSYLEYYSVGNKLGLPCLELQVRQNIDPYLEQIRVLNAPGGRFAGFLNAATLADFKRVNAPSYYRDDVRHMDEAYDAFLARHSSPSDYYAANIAIDPRERGHSAYTVLWDAIEQSARRAQCRRVLATVWGTNRTLILNRRRGMLPLATFDDAYPLFFDRLHLLEFPLQEAHPPAARPGDD